MAGGCSNLGNRAQRKGLGTSREESLIPKGLSLEPPFRLNEAWYRKNVERLQAKLAENDLDGVILKDRWNIIYFSGLFHSHTERPMWLFIPADGRPTIFHPFLDRDLVDSWWIRDREIYFDFPHHGPYGVRTFAPGPPAELLEWMLGGLEKRGFGEGRLGIEAEPGGSERLRMRKALPRAEFEFVGEICLEMRQVKTLEEIALIGKAVDLQDHMLEFARGLIVEYGTQLTDFDVRLETERYGTELLMERLELDGKPHHGAGIDLQISCRAGPATAYPHPNQFHYHQIEPGDAIQLAGFVHLGGYVGEGYRALQTQPMKDLQRRVWQVHTEMVELQAELCRPGERCNWIASEVLKRARDAGMERYVYHRPAHGIGMEGHQPPYLSLGDDSRLREGMVVSNEPGLYNPEAGWGYNHSNTILVTSEGGEVMNHAPLTEAWCWLEI